MIEPPKNDLLLDEGFPSDSSSNNAPHMMNIPEDEDESPNFGKDNTYEPKTKKQRKKV